MAYIGSGHEEPLPGFLGCGPDCNCKPCRSGNATLSEWYIPEEEDGIANVTRHGLYCGRGTRCGKSYCGRPIDKMDKCCQAYNSCFRANNLNVFARELLWSRPKASRCDRSFCTCLSKAPVSSPMARQYQTRTMNRLCPGL